jgi:hypothetical protein
MFTSRFVRLINDCDNIHEMSMPLSLKAEYFLNYFIPPDKRCQHKEEKSAAGQTAPGLCAYVKRFGLRRYENERAAGFPRRV